MASDGENNHDQTVNGPSVGETALTTESETPTTSTSSATVTRAPQPIFAIVAAPKVTSTSRDALIKWLKLRKEYEEVTKERCKDGKEDFDAVLKSVKNSFDDDLSTTLCEASWRGGGVSKSDLTDEYLLQQIHAITDSSLNQVLPPVNELFRKELKMNLSNVDIQSRVTNYFVSCNMLIKKYGFASFFEGEKGLKKKCKLLVNSLPEMFKEKVKNEIEYRFPEAQTSVLKLSNLINQQALEQAIEGRALKRGKETTRKLKPHDQPRSFQNKKRQMQGQQQQVDKRPKKVVRRKFEKPVEQKEESSKKGAQKDGCFHCGGAHYLSRCPTVTQEDRDRLTAEQKKKEVSAVRLEEPLTCKGADGKLIEVKMIENLHLRLRTAAGSVRVAKPVECLIIPGDSAEFLLGNDVLTMLGIDVQKQLDMFVANVVQSERDDEFDDKDEPQIDSGVDISDEVRAAVETLIEKAIEKGSPLEFVPALRRIATRFDIWRLKLGDDPPLMHKHLLVWIDDLLLFAKDASTYLEKLERLFELLDFFGFKISPKKSSLFEHEVRWCGKLINGNGVHHDPERIRSLQALPYPTTAGELQQFICATNWMRDSLVDYARVIRPLQDALDLVLSKASKRTKRVASGIAVDLSAVEREAYDEMKQLLSTSVTLAFPKEGATTCLLTDASDSGWSVLVSQVVRWEPRKEVHEQQHELLTCLSGKDVKKHIRGKLLRWSTKLMEYRYEVEHIDGESNVWADMISRWAGNHGPTVRLNVMQLRKRSREETAEPRPRRKRHRSGKNRPTVAATEEQRCLSLERQTTSSSTQQLRPLDDATFEWPTFNAILTVQKQYSDERPRSATGDDDNGWYIKDRVWIPKSAVGLVQRLLIVAHCGPQGHRGRDAMVACVSRNFDVHHLHSRVETFLRSCLMCKHVKGSKIIQRPWGETYRTNERNGALHFDFLSLGDSFEGDRYLLVLKDEATHFTELTPCANPTSTVVVDAMLAWYSRFGLPPLWISDQGSHFKNDVMAEVCQSLKARHEFTAAYSPWINGSVERANHDIIQALRVLCLEYKVDIHDWTFFEPMLQSSLNHTPVPSLGNRAPVELFCGLPLLSPLTLCMEKRQKEILEVPAHSAAISTWLGNLRKRIRELHKPMIQARERQTVRNQRAQRHAHKLNFDIGDYVLRSRVDQKHYNKLLVTWVGPYQIVRADKHSFAVRHLLTGEEVDVHPSRLKFYADCSLQLTEEFRNHIAAQGLVLSVAELKEVRWNNEKKDYEVQVNWKGLESIEVSWEPTQQLSKDIPVLLTQFATRSNDRKFERYVAAQIKPKSRPTDRPPQKA